MSVAGKIVDPLVVACTSGIARYPALAPFHPLEAYAEFPGAAVASSGANEPFRLVREALRLAGLDAARFGTAAWNPLGELIRPGETVLLKPNLVKEFHPRDPDGWQYVLTHGSIIRAAADYAFKAVGPKGTVIVADAPQTDSSFDKICAVLGLREIEAYYHGKGLDFRLIDLRKEEWTNRDGVITARRTLAGDPAGYVAFDLAEASEFVGHDGTGRYYGADYDSAELNRHHSGGKHEYLIAGTAVKADVVLSLPKLKTHKKAGITVSLKNLVGINGDKNWLPHHTEAGNGLPGDECPSHGGKHAAERTLVRWFRAVSRIPGVGGLIHRLARRAGRKVFGDTEEVIRSGNWWGNDTVWRMCLDLNKILLYGNPDGTLRENRPENRKRHFVLVDGVIAGAGRGPMNPDPVQAGLVVFGVNPASVDAACAVLMGFDPEKIPIVRQAFHCQLFGLAEWDWPDVQVASDRADWCGRLQDLDSKSMLRFEPHFGWKGRIERDRG